MKIGIRDVYIWGCLYLLDTGNEAIPIYFGEREVYTIYDRSFYSDLHEISDILIMLLICVELDKMPLLYKLKQLYKRLPVGFFNRYRVYR